MLKEGDKIYFEEDGWIHSGKIIELTPTSFELDNYGSCEGNCKIDRSMIGYTFFQSKEELMKHLNIK